MPRDQRHIMRVIRLIALDHELQDSEKISLPVNLAMRTEVIIGDEIYRTSGPDRNRRGKIKMREPMALDHMLPEPNLGGTNDHTGGGRMVVWVMPTTPNASRAFVSFK